MKNTFFYIKLHHHQVQKKTKSVYSSFLRSSFEDKNSVYINVCVCDRLSCKVREEEERSGIEKRR